MPQPRYRQLDWYEHPLYYDIGIAPGSEDEAVFLEEVLSAHGRSEGFRVLEPACGSGRLLLEMAKRGYEVAGFDAKEAMVDFARRRLEAEGLSGDLRQAWMQDFDLGAERFDLAFCLVCSFQHLLSEEEAVAHLRCVERSLQPGGLYVLGFHLADYVHQGLSRERWVAERDGVEVTCNLSFWPPDPCTRREKARARLKVRHHGAAPKLYETTWEFRTYDLEELQRLLDAVPGLRHVATYDFRYEIESPRELEDDHLDVVLVLRREPFPSGAGAIAG